MGYIIVYAVKVRIMFCRDDGLGKFANGHKRRGNYSITCVDK